MTAIQKKPDNPIAHLTDEDVESARPRARRHPRAGPRQPRRARRRLHPQGHRRAAPHRAGQPRRAAVLAVPAGVAARHGRPVDLQDPREHGDRPQRHARPVGLDARPEDPLDRPGSGTTPPRRRHVEALAQPDPPHVHQRARPRQRPRLRDHARRRGPALVARSTWASRSGTSSTPASSSTASPRTTSRSARSSRAARTRTSSGQQLARRPRARSAAGDPRLRACTRCCPARRR